MDDAELFPQVLDLEFSLGSAVKVELESDVTFAVTDRAITGFGNLLAVGHHLKDAVLSFLHQGFRNLDQFVEMARFYGVVGRSVEVPKLENAIIGTEVL